MIETLLTTLLSGFIPVCAWRRRIRAESAAWHPLETDVLMPTSAQLPHGIGPDGEQRAHEAGIGKTG